MTQQTVIDKIKTALATITTVNGYYSNIGLKVTEGKTNPWGENRMDGVDVIDGDEDIDTTITEDNSVENHSLQVSIKTIAKSPFSPQVARKHIADVRKAMLSLKNDTTWLELVTRWTNTKNTKEMEQESLKIIGTESLFIIEFNTLELEED